MAQPAVVLTDSGRPQIILTGSFFERETLAARKDMGSKKQTAPVVVLQNAECRDATDSSAVSPHSSSSRNKLLRL